MAFRERLTTLRRSRRDNGLRISERTKMDQQRTVALHMGASKSSHNERMANRIFRQPRIPHYPQVRRSYTPIAEIL